MSLCRWFSRETDGEVRFRLKTSLRRFYRGRRKIKTSAYLIGCSRFSSFLCEGPLRVRHEESDLEGDSILKIWWKSRFESFSERNILARRDSYFRFSRYTDWAVSYCRFSGRVEGQKSVGYTFQSGFCQSGKRKILCAVFLLTAVRSSV